MKLTTLFRVHNFLGLPTATIGALLGVVALVVLLIFDNRAVATPFAAVSAVLIGFGLGWRVVVGVDEPPPPEVAKILDLIDENRPRGWNSRRKHIDRNGKF